jgi:hypothetical protein
VGVRLKSKRFIDQMGSWYQPLAPRKNEDWQTNGHQLWWWRTE